MFGNFDKYNPILQHSTRKKYLKINFLIMFIKGSQTTTMYSLSYEYYMIIFLQNIKCNINNLIQKNIFFRTLTETFILLLTYL